MSPAPATGKGGKTRRLPVSGRAVAMLADYQARHRPAPPPGLAGRERDDDTAALLVSIRDRRLTPRDVQRVVARHARQIDAHVTPHGLRHTALSALGHSGVPVATIGDIAGHASLSATSVYIDHDPAAAARRAVPVPAGPVGRQGGPTATTGLRGRHPGRCAAPLSSWAP